MLNYLGSGITFTASPDASCGVNCSAPSFDFVTCPSACLYLKTWSDLCITYIGISNQYAFYLNGQLQCSGVQYMNTNTTQEETFVGSNGFLGALDDILIYSRALTQTEITAIYNEPNPTPTPTPTPNLNNCTSYCYGNGDAPICKNNCYNSGNAPECIEYCLNYGGLAQNCRVYCFVSAPSCDYGCINTGSSVCAAFCYENTAKDFPNCGRACFTSGGNSPLCSNFCATCNDNSCATESFDGTDLLFEMNCTSTYSCPTGGGTDPICMEYCYPIPVPSLTPLPTTQHKRLSSRNLLARS